MAKKIIQNRALYGALSHLYDFITERKGTKKETLFLHRVFKEHGKNIKTVLDVGCGTGRHADLLVRLGYRVVGIDSSERMLKVARQKVPAAKFLKMDMRRIRLYRPVDAAISMWATACYLRDNDFKKFIAGLHRSVRELIVLDFPNFQNREVIKPGLVTTHRQKGNIFMAKHVRSVFTKRFRKLYFTYTIENKLTGATKTYHDLAIARMYTLSELKRFFNKKFTAAGLYGDYDIRRLFLPKRSQRLIVVLRRVL